MTKTADIDIETIPEHFVLSGVSWEYYEHTLEEIGNRTIRVSFLDGTIEMMSPLPGHDTAKRAIGRLVETLTLELRWPHKSFGSTTFRRKEKQAGAEPDECYYFHSIDSVKGMKRFNPRVHRAPDLWIEVDILSPSVPRETIFARLGVPEVWRYNKKGLTVRLLAPEGVYVDSPASRAFPFLPMKQFARFIPRMIEEDETVVSLDFSAWVRTLPRS